MSFSGTYADFLDKYMRCPDAIQTGYDQTYRVESKHGGNFYTCREISYGSIVQDAPSIDPGVFTSLESIDHPCIVKIHNVYHDIELKKLFIVSELLTSSTVKELIMAHVRTREVMTEEVLWKVAAYISSAIYYLLFQFKGCPIGSFFKRFITTSDCVISKDGVVKLLLTDLMFLFNSNYIKLMAHDKQSYCSPEILMSLAYDNKSEMWSLGAILYELCTLKKLVETPNPVQMQSHIASLEGHIIIPGYSEDFCTLLNGLIRLSPGNRFSAEYVCSIRQCVLVLDTIKSQFESLYKYKRDYIPVYNGSYKWDHTSTAPAVYNELQLHTQKSILPQPPPHPMQQTSSTVIHGTDTYAYSNSSNVTQTLTPYTVNTYFNSTSIPPQTEVIPVSVDSRLEKRDRDPGGFNTTYADAYVAPQNPVLYDHAMTENKTGVANLMAPVPGTTSQYPYSMTATLTAHNAYAGPSLSQQPPTSYTLQNLFHDQQLHTKSNTYTNTYTTTQPVTSLTNFTEPHFDSDRNERALPYDMIGSIPVQVPSTFSTQQPPCLQPSLHSTDLNPSKYSTRPDPIYKAATQTVIVADIEQRMQLKDKTMNRSANITDMMDATLLMNDVVDFNNNGVMRHISLAGKRTREGITALMLAASVGNIHAINTIIEYDGSISQKETRMQDYANGKTALMYAVEGQHEDAVNILAKHEATLTLNDGTSALMLAAVRSNDRIVETLAKLEGGMVDSIGRTALIHAMGIHNYKAVAILAPLEGEKMDHNGLTPLMIAAKLGDDELTSILKLCGLHIRTPAGETALMAAAAAGHVAVCRSLAPQYAGAANIIGMTALMYAAEAGNAEVCEILLQYERGKRDTVGRTALMYAASTGQIACVRKLMRDEERLRSIDGSTALIIAAEQGYASVVAELAKREAGISRHSDETALSMAIMNNRKDCIRILMKEEGSVKCPGGLTPVQYAEHLNRKEILEEITAFLQAR